MNKRQAENRARLFANLATLGFTYEESNSLRRIEMTLQRWGERECGDGSDWAIERDETTGKPFNVYHGEGKARRYEIADKETGAIRRLGKIVGNRNTRHWAANGQTCIAEMPGTVIPYHQGDCRGCNVYLCTREQLTDRQTGEPLPIDQYYTRGLAVCI